MASVLVQIDIMDGGYLYGFGAASQQNMEAKCLYCSGSTIVHDQASNFTEPPARNDLRIHDVGAGRQGKIDTPMLHETLKQL